jgi:hypothetical protein
MLFLGLLPIFYIVKKALYSHIPAKFKSILHCKIKKKEELDEDVCNKDHRYKHNNNNHERKWFFGEILG